MICTHQQMNKNNFHFSFSLRSATEGCMCLCGLLTLEAL